MKLGDTFRCEKDPEMDLFFNELIDLFKKHKKIISPTFEGEISFHDPMVIIPLDKNAEDFVQKISFDPLMFGK